MLVRLITQLSTRLSSALTWNAVTGFTVLDNAYLWNGTFYLVHSDVSAPSFPERRLIVSSGAAIGASQEEREPTDENLQVISISGARKLFGDRIVRLDGTSVSRPPSLPYGIVNDNLASL